MIAALSTLFVCSGISFQWASIAAWPLHTMESLLPSQVLLLRLLITLVVRHVCPSSCLDAGCLRGHYVC